jgi:hypothetical protein
MKIRSSSITWAIQDVNEYYCNLSKTQYEELITQLTGIPIPVSIIDTLVAEITFKYIIQGIIQNLLCDTKKTILDIVNEAAGKANKLVDENGNIMRMLRNPVDIKTKDINVIKTIKKVTHKFGISRRDQANELIEQNKLLDKSAVLDILVIEMMIKKPNANVYYTKWKDLQIE